MSDILKTKSKPQKFCGFFFASYKFVQDLLKTQFVCKIAVAVVYFKQYEFCVNKRSQMKRAITLAGGGSLGSYEIGAVMALKELGVDYQIVTGTSIGALNGAFVVMDELEKAKQMWFDITADKVMRDGINISKKLVSEFDLSQLGDINNWLKIYLKSGFCADITRFKHLIKENVDLQKIKRSPIKFGAVCSTFPTLKRVDIDLKSVPEDQMLAWLHASSACTPVFPVETIDGKKYVDGFFNDNLPIRLAFAYGADEVVAIDMQLFSLKPQNSFYLSLPNVKYVAPYIEMGSMMDFSQTVIQNNFLLGYLDTFKEYKKYRGYCFAFEDDFDCSGFLADMLKRFSTDSKYVINVLKKDIRTPMDEKDFFVRTLEIIAQKLKIQSYYKVFSVQEFCQTILQKKKEQSLPQKMQLVQKITNFASKILESDTKEERLFAKYLEFFESKYLNVNQTENNSKYLQIKQN